MRAGERGRAPGGGRNGVREGGPAFRATAAPPMGMAKDYRQQQKRPPPGHGSLWCRLGGRSYGFCLSNLSVTNMQARRINSIWLSWEKRDLTR